METFSELLVISEGNPLNPLVTDGLPFTKASDAEIWCFLWSAPAQMFKQTIETPVIWDAIAPIMSSV